MVRINICVCTYQRTESLMRCLDSLSKVDSVNSVTISVLVVDNDVSGTAEFAVMQLKSTFPFPLEYVCEKKRGIPCARNRAIDEANLTACDYLIFVDDDEWVEKDWLKNIYEYCVKSGGQSIIHGKVIPELPKDTPANIKGLFGAKSHATGTNLSSCATDNVMIPAKVYRDLGIRFDEQFPFAGGTDTKYFVEAVEKGVRILQCSEAIVYEEITQSRANLRWLSRRKYRAGITEAWKKGKKGRGKVRILAAMFLRVVIETVKMVFFVVVCSGLKRNQSWLKLCKAIGVCAGVLGARVDSYKVIS